MIHFDFDKQTILPVTRLSSSAPPPPSQPCRVGCLDLESCGFIEFKAFVLVPSQSVVSNYGFPQAGSYTEILHGILP